MIKLFKSIGIIAVLLIVLPVTGYFFFKAKDLFSFSPENEKRKENIISTKILKRAKIVKVKLYGSLSEGVVSIPKIRIKKGVIYIKLLKGMVRMGKDNHYVPLNPYEVLILTIPGKKGQWRMKQATEFPVVKDGEIKFVINKNLQGDNIYTIIRKNKTLDFGALEFAVFNLPTPLGKGTPPKPILVVKNPKIPEVLTKGKALANKWLGKIKGSKNSFNLLAKAREKDVSSELLPALEKTAKAMKVNYQQTKTITKNLLKKEE